MNDSLTKKPKLVALYPINCLNVYLTKDFGMIPFILHKYLGYDSWIACYKGEDLSYMDSEVKGLKIDFIEKKGTDIEDGERYLERKASDIDVLFLLGIYPSTITWIKKYKALNPMGKVYLKLDANIHWMNRLELSKEIFNLLKRCDVISVESKRLYTYLNRKWPLKIEYIPNGFYNFYNSPKVTYREKENTILTVGRIGTAQKANEILLKAFKLAAPEIPGWRIKLIGNIEEEFMHFIDQFLVENPSLRDRIEIPGPIENRIQLEQEYRRAKIFCLTSRVEGFPLVFPEAAINGCFIASTNLEPAYDITDNEKYGSLFPVDDYAALANMLIHICNDENKMEQICCDIQDYTEDNFNWITICKKLNLLFQLSQVGVSNV